MAERNNSNMLFANFNQDFSCISIGTKRGYSITNCDPFGRVYTMNDGARGIVEMLFCTSLIALVGAADHPQSSPRKLQIVNTKRQSMICELLFPSSILAVKMNRKTLVIVLETEIYIYDISNMRLLHVIETSPNPEAICALSPSADSSYLAYPSPVPSSSSLPLSSVSSPPPSHPSSSSNPSSSPHPSAGATTKAGTTGQSGDVLLFSTRSLTVSNVIQAHKSPISFLAINSSGTMLASSSDKGTVIRVWSIPGAEKLYQFRRGTRETKIYSINFNLVSTLMCVSSAHGTVHVFKLGRSSSSSSSASSSSQNAASSSSSASIMSGTTVVGDVKSLKSSASGGGVSPDSDSASLVDGSFEPSSTAGSSSSGGGGGGWKKKGLAVGRSLGYTTRSLTSSTTRGLGGYLPNMVTEMWEPVRHFASLKLPVAGGVKSVVGISATMPHVMVISSEGYFYLYSIDLENGGECVLLKQYSLLDSVDVDPSEEAVSR